MPEQILVVDDDALMLRTLQLRLTDEGYGVEVAPDGFQAIDACRRREFDLVISDIKMPGIDGLETLRRVKELQPSIKSVLITGFASDDAPIRAIRLGVDDYLFKPFEDEQFIHCVQRILFQLKLERDNRLLLEQLQQENEKLGSRVRVLQEQERRQMDFGQIVAESDALRNLLDQVRRVAPTRSSVLLLGESGTGKELIARALHEASPRGKECFVAINCAAFSRELLESELFGHRRGAFTGAESDRRGLMEEASGGTLLFDEIGDLPLDLQSKLLRVLEEGRLRRIGENTERSVDLRIVSATNCDLEYRVEEGLFRRDLFYRLNTVTLRVPPLRERPDDIEPLAWHFLQRFAREQAKTVRGFRPEILEWMRRQPWKGNIRELRNAIERAVIFADPQGWIDRPELGISNESTPPLGKADAPSGSLAGELIDYEKRLIAKALEETSGQIARAAEKLGISRTNLHNKLTRLGLRDAARPDPGQSSKARNLR